MTDDQVFLEDLQAARALIATLRAQANQQHHMQASGLACFAAD